MYQYFLFQVPPKNTQIGIFWVEIIPSGNPEVEKGDCRLNRKKV
jgi:hypothetical protein